MLTLRLVESGLLSYLGPHLLSTMLALSRADTLLIVRKLRYHVWLHERLQLELVVAVSFTFGGTPQQSQEISSLVIEVLPSDRPEAIHFLNSFRHIGFSHTTIAFLRALPNEVGQA